MVDLDLDKEGWSHVHRLYSEEEMDIVRNYIEKRLRKQDLGFTELPSELSDIIDFLRKQREHVLGSIRDGKLKTDEEVLAEFQSVTEGYINQNIIRLIRSSPYISNALEDYKAKKGNEVEGHKFLEVLFDEFDHFYMIAPTRNFCDYGHTIDVTSVYPKIVKSKKAIKQNGTELDVEINMFGPDVVESHDVYVDLALKGRSTALGYLGGGERRDGTGFILFLDNILTFACRDWYNLTKDRYFNEPLNVNELFADTRKPLYEKVRSSEDPMVDFIVNRVISQIHSDTIHESVHLMQSSKGWPHFDDKELTSAAKEIQAYAIQSSEGPEPNEILNLALYQGNVPCFNIAKKFVIDQLVEEHGLGIDPRLIASQLHIKIRSRGIVASNGQELDMAALAKIKPEELCDITRKIADNPLHSDETYMRKYLS